jgi:hypothetical protein
MVMSDGAVEVAVTELDEGAGCVGAVGGDGGCCGGWCVAAGSQSPGFPSLSGVWASGPNDAWAVGSVSGGVVGGTPSTIVHWNGVAWSIVPDATTAAGLAGVWGSGPNDVLAFGMNVAGLGNLARGGANGWTTSTVGSVSDSFYGAWGTGPNDIWLAGDEAVAGNFFGKIMHSNGVAWSSSGNPGFSTLAGPALRGVWGSGPNDVWAVGANSILHGDGTVWDATVESAPLLRGVWGSGPNDVWAVGGASILHWDGTAWDAAASGIARQLKCMFNGVWSSGPDDVWFVGSQPNPRSGSAILHWSGGAWTIAKLPTPQLLGVWGRAPNDVWAVGDSGVILHHGD